MTKETTNGFYLNDGVNGFWFDGKSLWIKINNLDGTIRDFFNRQFQLITICTAKVVDQTPIPFGLVDVEQKTLWRVDNKTFGFPYTAANLFNTLKEDFLGNRKDTESNGCLMIYPNDEFKGRDVKTFTADEFVRWINLRCELCGEAIPKGDGAKEMFAKYVEWHKCMQLNPGCYQGGWRDGSCCYDVTLSLQKNHTGPYDQIIKCSFVLGDYEAVDQWIDHLKEIGY